MTRGVPLGSFSLDGVLGAGGGGIVWRGVHQRLGLPVAVKVLPPRANRHARHAILNEVQAVARLHHAHVVTVLDAGEVDEAAARAAAARGRPMEVGSPYLVIELASGGDLRVLSPPCSWAITSDVVRSLLGALAHAHARGVVHRDLKPQNILICTSADVRPGLKLTDFGIALVGEQRGEPSGGTPLFMAPEQFELHPADVGPWSDLYALGCVARWLATGAPPFQATRWQDYAALHQRAAPPPLPADVDAPAGFASWLARLLEKDPASRFRRAADADAALHALDPARPAPPLDRLPTSVVPLLGRRVTTDAQSTAPTRRRRGQAPAPTGPSASQPPASPFARVGHAVSEPHDGASTTAPPADVGAAPVARSWRTGGAAPHTGPLVEAGLALFALRPVPVIGRDEECDALWRALVEVHDRSAPRAVVLRGPSGVGKSRLAEWLVHRAHETGAATVLDATFAPSPGRADGLAGAVARLVGLGSVPADAAEERARHWRDRWLGHADLTARELCALGGVGEGVFANADDKDGALVRLFSALGRERPVVVWLDDVHWARHALAFVERALADARELPVLFVCTAVDELCDVGVRAQLEALLAKDGAEAVPVERLDDASASALCAHLIGRDDARLIQALRRRTEGNPLFAVHIVRDWVQRGLLVPGQAPALHGGALPELPDALHSLWDRRVAAALDSDEERAALELAAALGGNVDLVEWETACGEERIGSAVLDVVLDAVVAAGLARRTDAGLVFVHVLVRASIERRARDEERLARHHAAAAAALELLWGTDTPVAAARIGRHRLAAGDAGAALAPLFSAARAAVEEGDVLEAKALLDDWTRARVASGVADADQRMAPALILQATVADREGHHDEARRLADRAAAAAARDRRAFASARRVAAEAATASGKLDEAAALLEEARATSAAEGDRLGLAQALRALGDVQYWRGARAPAARLYREAHGIFQTVGRQLDVAASLWSLGYVELERGDLPAARALFLEQRALCRTIRDRLGEANATNALGELERRAGDLDAAEAHYRAALRMATKSGLSRRWTFRLNLAHTLLARGDVTGAMALVEELVHSPKASAEPMVMAPAWWICAVAAAARGDLAAWDRAVSTALAVAETSAVVEEDLAFVAETAARMMEPHDPERAARARTWAAHKRAALAGGP